MALRSTSACDRLVRRRSAILQRLRACDGLGPRQWRNGTMGLMRGRYARPRNCNARRRATVEPFEFYGETPCSGLRREVLFVVELLQALGVKPPFALNVAGA
jgi:hypothetical protein